MLDFIGDFIRFRIFVTPYFLVAVYYLGALGVPFFAWYIAFRLKKKEPEWLAAASRSAWSVKVMPYKARIVTIGLVLFLLMELFWRMMFEAMLAYFQIREAMMILSS
jgi:hypothetical protein